MSETTEEDWTILKCSHCRKRIGLTVDLMDNLYEREIPTLCRKCFGIQNNAMKQEGLRDDG